MSGSTGDMTPDEQRARVAAVRGLMRARDEQFDAARGCFAEAARLDPRLDLATIPNFWNLPSAAHQAAIDAYESVGRERDAAVLIARIRKTFRPRLVSVTPPERAPAT